MQAKLDELNIDCPCRKKLLRIFINQFNWTLVNCYLKILLGAKRKCRTAYWINQKCCG